MRHYLMIFLLIWSYVVFGQDVFVQGYYKKDGQYVIPHYRSPRNNIFHDNFSSRGNINPYTLKAGWKTEKTYFAHVKAFEIDIEIDNKLLEDAVIQNNIERIDLYLRSCREDQKSLIKALSFMYAEKYKEARDLILRIMDYSVDNYIRQEALQLLKTANLLLGNLELEQVGININDLRFSNGSYCNFKNILPKLKLLNEVENQSIRYDLPVLIYFETYDIEGLNNLIKENYDENGRVMLAEDVFNKNLVLFNNKAQIETIIELLNKSIFRDQLVSENKLFISLEVLTNYFESFVFSEINGIPIKESSTKEIEILGFNNENGRFHRETYSVDSLRNFLELIEVIKEPVDRLNLYRLSFSTNDEHLYKLFLRVFEKKYNFTKYEGDLGLFSVTNIGRKERFGLPESPLNIVLYEINQESKDPTFFVDLFCIENDGKFILLNKEN